MQEVATHAAAQRYKEAAAVRDDAIRLRNAVVKHRRSESLWRTGRLVLEICRDGTVELHDGVFDESGSGGEQTATPIDRVQLDTVTTDQEQDRAVAAQWLHVHAESVRVVHAEHSLCWPALRIPELTDLAKPQSAQIVHGRPEC